jgi:hypothetical protein
LCGKGCITFFIKFLFCPTDALLIRTDLQRARDQFVMSTELHLTYLVVPANNHDVTPDWKR